MVMYDIHLWWCMIIIDAFQLNISYPSTGCQKLIEIDDEKKLRPFYEKRISAEVPADSLGDEWKVHGDVYVVVV